MKEGKQTTLDDVHELLTDYIKSDIEWKKQADPVIRMGQNLRGFYKTFGIIVGVCVGLGSIFAAVKYFAIFLMEPLRPK